MRRALLCALALSGAGCTKSKPPPLPQLSCAGAQPFLQWGQDPAHSGTTCNEGQPLTSVLADVVYDPFVEQEKAEAGGDLLAHYMAPLVDGDDVFMMSKAGQYVSCSPPGKGQPAPCGPDAWSAQVWGLKRYQWQGATLGAVWAATTDWKPPPNGSAFNGWEPVFHPAVSATSVWVPAAGGSVLQLDRATGSVVKRHQPLGSTLDPDAYVAGPLTVDAQGSVLYNAVKLDHAKPWGADVQGAWLVRISASGATQAAPFAALVPGAPSGATCTGTFAGPRQDGDPPLPPPDVNGQPAKPNLIACGSQRPGINVAPAVGADGTIFTISRAHFVSRYAYVVAVNPDLSPRWATSLRGFLNDGCGVTLPSDGATFDCATYARRGVDPFTNEQPAGRVSDEGTSSPVALPDGGVLYGALTTYNGSRGHLFALNASGAIQFTYDFGWDVTPAVFPHDGTYSIVTKDNHYAGPGPYQITQLDAQLRPEWAFTATNTKACARDASGAVSCQPDPDAYNGFEWCVNAPVVDKNGVVYANSEDGWLYAINPGGSLKQSIFLQTALGAAYTPLSIDGAGRIYTQNDGHLFVVGQ